MNHANNEQKKRKRKMLLFLPLLMIPFLSLAFWALGGGKKDSHVTQQEGLNAVLPDAKIPDEAGMDKMAFYDKAEQEQRDGKGVPEFGVTDEIIPTSKDSLDFPNPTLNGSLPGAYEYGLSQGVYTGNSTENKIRSRLQELQQKLREAETNNKMNNTADLEEINNSHQADRLNETLQKAGQGEKDPEMEQLQEMMKRIYDVQHPEIVKEELKRQSMQNRGLVYPVNKEPEAFTVSLLQSKNDSINQLKKTNTNGFYGLEKEKASQALADAGIKATIQDNTTVVNGTTIKMRLLQDIYINGSFIPKGNFVTGTAAMRNDRIQIEVTSMLHNNSLYNVNLLVYDMDGMDGIYVPGSVIRDVVKQSGTDAIQSIGIGSIDPSISAQATAAGIETAKNLLSKKIKLVKVFIKAGHQVLLKDNNHQ